jgi:hypothetical protein
MDTEPGTGKRRRAVSAAAREKCIKRARKTVEIQEKWGYYAAAFCFLIGLAAFGMGVWFIVLIQDFAQMGGNAGPAGQNPFGQGFVVGMLLGIILINVFFHSAKAIAAGIRLLRANVEEHMLVEYHDTVVNLMLNEPDHPPLCEPQMLTTPHKALSASESNV